MACSFRFVLAWTFFHVGKEGNLNRVKPANLDTQKESSDVYTEQ